MGLKLKELRTQKGLYQKDVAAMLGVDRTTYAKYETGDSEPSLEMLSKMADFFDVSLGYISGKEQEKKPTPVSGDAKKEENEHYGSLSDLYYTGVRSWIDKGFFSADEQTMLKEHFSGVLSRYKELIDRTSGIKRSLKIHLKAMAPLSREMNSPLSAQEIAEQFLKQELMREISSLTSYIDAYAFHFAHTVIKENLAGQVPSEEMDRQREQWEVENYRKCLISEQLQAEQQKKPTPVDEGELLELFKMYVERLSPDQLQMIFDQARSMWEQNKVRDQMQRMIGQQKAPSSVAVRQITDETAQ